MNILIKNTLIFDPESPFHEQRKDVFIADGKISAINDHISESSDVVIEGNQLLLSPGFADLKTDLCDPGNEHKETIASGRDAAAAGGYTHLGVLPIASVVTDHKGQVEYFRRPPTIKCSLIVPRIDVLQTVQRNHCFLSSRS
jgi:dihydroorotase